MHDHTCGHCWVDMVVKALPYAMSMGSFALCTLLRPVRRITEYFEKQKG